MTEGTRKHGREIGGMSRRTASWLAWSLWALSVALTALSLLFLALSLSHPDADIFDHWVDSTLVAIAFSTVGAVIAPRTPSDNPIGWLFCVVGLLIAVTHFSAEYAIFYTLLAAPGSQLPGGEAAAWLTSWLWLLQLGCFLLVVLLFPDGRLPSRGWRWFVWLSVPLVLMGALLCAFSPGPILALGPIHNPLAVESLPNVYKSVERLFYTLAVVAAISLFIRLRRARELERQQIKWFVYATALERVMNSIRNGLGMRETEIAREPSRP